MGHVTSPDFDFEVIGSGFGAAGVSVNLRVNPILTITARSQHIMAQIPQKALPAPAS